MDIKYLMLIEFIFLLEKKTIFDKIDDIAKDVVDSYCFGDDEKKDCLEYLLSINLEKYK